MADILQIKSALQTLAATDIACLPDRVSAPAPANQETESNQETKQRRTICVRFYITAEEEARLNRLTDGINNRSRWLRAKAFGQAPPRPRLHIPEINREIYTTVKYLRSEANQITKALNTALARKQVVPLSEESLSTLKNIQKAIETTGMQLVKLNGLHQLDGEDES